MDEATKEKLRSGEIAVITDIQRYSVHDGPGIRSLVFFKGCPLRCQWCHNPETHDPAPELLYNQELCIGCGVCVSVCPKKAIHIESGRLVTDKKRCTACGKCTEVCYAEAREISGKYCSVDEIFEKVMRDRAFYTRTGGGVTLSGGEVLMHARFAVRLLKKLKETGVHTAIETCGYSSWENFKSLLEYTDLVLFDIKQPDDEIHRKYTGRSNVPILENLRKAATMGKRIIIRVPLIPGVNASVETLKQIAAIAEEVHAQEFHILPFHQIGMSKWDAEGREYLFKDVQEPEKDELDALVTKLGKLSMPIVVGGN